MINHDQKETSPEILKSQESFYKDDIEPGTIKKNEASSASSAWQTDIEKTMLLGEQFVGVLGGMVELARMEAQLAVRTLPKLMMLWLLIMPVMLLVWCSFSVLAAWSVYAASEQTGLGLLTFFLLQVILLLICRWAFVAYKARMSFPYTRAQVVDFMRSVKDEINTSDKTKE